MQDHFNFRLKSGRDNELIQWLNSRNRRERSAFIREALRQHVKGVDRNDGRYNGPGLH
jgi:hypothetical protein